MSADPTPLVSVVIAAYNVGPYIERAVVSALTQTLSNIEVLVIDDASSDDTARRVRTLAQRDPRVSLISLEENGGVSIARNHGLAAARGKWIAILDGDDWYEPLRLEVLVREGDRLGADWIADDQYIIRDGARGPAARLFVREPHGARLIDAVHVVDRDPPEFLGYGLLKPLLRRSFLVRSGCVYPSVLRRYEDFLFLVAIATQGGRLALLNEPLYWYRLRANSLTKLDPRAVMKAMIEVSAAARTLAEASGDTALVAALEAREKLIRRGARYYRCVIPWKEGEPGRALRSLALDPLIWPYVTKKLLVRTAYRAARRDPLGLVLQRKGLTLRHH